MAWTVEEWAAMTDAKKKQARKQYAYHPCEHFHENTPAQSDDEDEDNKGFGDPNFGNWQEIDTDNEQEKEEKEAEEEEEEEEETPENLIPFKPGSSIIISGSSGSGKTQWVKRFIQNINYMYNGKKPAEIMFCYSVWQDLYDEIKLMTRIEIVFHEGLPDRETIFEFSEDRVHKLIVIDDLMHKAVDNQEIELLFTQYCHHRNLSCIYIQQNLFMKGKHAKTIGINAWYMVLFDNVRDKNQVMYLGRQLHPRKSKSFVSLYESAVKKPWSYLVLDLSPGMFDVLRLRTGVFPDECLEVHKLH